jgi:tetratricopeptide (TPR) repeat protein
MLGMLYGESGEFDKSAEAYQRVLEIEPTRSSAWMGLGNIAWLRDDLTEAQRLYRVALEHDNQNYEALVNLGNVCEALGEKQEAYRYRELARPLGPDAQVSPAKEEKF